MLEGGVSLAQAYSATGAAWERGPARVYDRLAEVLVARCPGGVRGRLVLDLGAGTGAASRAALRADARAVVALDVAAGMLAVEAAARPPAVVGDAGALPFAGASFGAVVAAFSLNHLAGPAGALAEAARVLAPSGGLAVSTYAVEDAHPVKAASEAACAERGWRPPAWYQALQRDAIPRMATVERARAVAREAGLDDAVADLLAVELGLLDAVDVVAWRLGMAHVAPFVAGLASDDRARLASDILDRLGPHPPPLVRRVVVLTWHRPVPVPRRPPAPVAAHQPRRAATS